MEPTEDETKDIHTIEDLRFWAGLRDEALVNSFLGLLGASRDDRWRIIACITEKRLR